ncbi:hypothetical protein BAC3_01968 [uncultured bacterium]|nr:hypothetical protein BAC3_01968 [uncultured bacterium]
MKNYSYTLLLGLMLCSTSLLAVEKASPERMAEVQQHGQDVLTYDESQTEQMFTKTVHGGVQHVIVKTNDTEQIKLVQAHLKKMSEDFSKGDFSDTERIHGVNMPGLMQLKTAQPYDIKYEYKALPNGAQIHYATEYPQFVNALHEWFEAQAKDHGNTVIKEHAKHHATPAE